MEDQKSLMDKLLFEQAPTADLTTAPIDAPSDLTVALVDKLDAAALDAELGSAPASSEVTSSIPLQLGRPGLTLEAQVEAIIFASPEPIRSTQIAEVLAGEFPLTQIEDAIDDLIEHYACRGGGIRLEYIKGAGVQFRTAADAAPLMERQFAIRPRPLSKSALETLAVIAYRQPATRADVEFVRGVDSGSIIKGLLDKNLIACVGRKEDTGRPMLFGTTTEFLQVFGLASIRELPPLSSFQPAPDTMRQAMERLEGATLAAPPVDVAELEAATEEFDKELLPIEGVIAAAAATKAEPIGLGLEGDDVSPAIEIVEPVPILTDVPDTESDLA